MDQEIINREAAGTPGLTLAVIAMACFWIYRFWVVGLPALPGNLRFAGLCAAALLSFRRQRSFSFTQSG